MCHPSRLFALALFGLAGLLAHAAVITVGPTGDYATIGEAITNAADGDEIQIAAGSYDEALEISGRQDLTLKGDPGGGTIIAIGAGTAANQGVLINGSTGIVLQDLTIDMTADNGVEYRAAIQAMEKSTFTANNVIMTGGGRNVSLWRGAEAELIDCELTNVSRSGGNGGGIEIGSDEDYTTNTAMYTTVEATGCLFQHTEYPVYINPFATLGNTVARTRVGSLTFRDCEFDSNGGASNITMRFMTGQWEPGSEVLFEDCKFSNWAGYNFHMDGFPMPTQAPEHVTFRRCEMIKLDASTSNAALYCNYACPIILENTAIATWQSEVIYLGARNEGLTVTHCTLANVNPVVIAARAMNATVDAVVRNSIIAVRTTTPNRPPLTGYNEGTPLHFDLDYTISNSLRDDDDGIQETVTTPPTLGANYVWNNTDENYANFINWAHPATDMQLGDPSPALGAGADLGYTDDVLGKSRPNPAATNPDLGAYESYLVPAELSEFQFD